MPLQVVKWSSVAGQTSLSFTGSRRQRRSHTISGIIHRKHARLLSMSLLIRNSLARQVCSTRMWYGKRSLHMTKAKATIKATMFNHSADDHEKFENFERSFPIARTYGDADMHFALTEAHKILDNWRRTRDHYAPCDRKRHDVSRKNPGTSLSEKVRSSPVVRLGRGCTCMWSHKLWRSKHAFACPK